MSRLPTGTVTFLFTDIEGSTRLLEHLGPRYSDVLVDYRGLLRGAFQERSGREVDTQGDGLFYAFGNAKDGVAGAIAAQRAAAAHPWPDGLAVRIRMGMHTGEPLLTEAGYIGMDVYRAARICSVGHGGQILISAQTSSLVQDEAPDQATLVDLGEHRLKDLSRPERIFQIAILGLPTNFPRLRSLDTRTNNLPSLDLTSFVGREREMAAIKSLLATSRLVTLLGAAGVGKTRLALQVTADLSDSFPGGVWQIGRAHV